MVGFTRPRTFRDVALIFLGAAGMHFTTSFLGPFTEHTSSIVVQTQVSFRLVFCDPCVPRTSRVRIRARYVGRASGGKEV